MYLSRAGFEFIKRWEGCRLVAYPDGGGVWTIGFGNTKYARKGLKIDLDQAETWLLEDVLYVEEGVRDLVRVPLRQTEFDALLSFAFNCGLDQDPDDKAEGLGDSTLLKRVNAGDWQGAGREFLRWNKDNGKVVKGLTNRRKAEARLFLEGLYSGLSIANKS